MKMTDLRKAAEMALEVMEYNRANGTPNMGAAIEALRQALAQDSLRKLAEIDRELGLFDEPKQPEQEPETVMAKYEFQTYAAYKDGGEMKIGVVPEPTAWVTAGEHTVPLETAAPVDAVNMRQERVDETAKNRHEPWPSVQCVCVGTIYFKYTPPISDYHEGWEEGFKAAKREWVGLTRRELDIATLGLEDLSDCYKAIEAKLKEKNT